MKKILVALRDIGSARMIGPLTPLLATNGYEVVSYLEGQAITLYPELSGMEGTIVVSDIDKAVLTGEQWNDMRTRIFEDHFEMVIVGNSTPPGGEVDIGRMANTKNIPLVMMDDVGGGWKRIPSISPALLVTTTARAGLRASIEFPHAHVAVCGLPAFPIEPISVPPVLVEKISEIKKAFTAVTFFTPFGAGTVEAMEEQVQFFAECISKTPMTAIVTSVHPKSRMVLVDGISYEERWNALLRETFHERYINLENKWSGDVLASVADCTVGGGSGVMLRAVFSGTRAVAIATPSIRLHQEEIIGVPECPWSELIPEITTPTDIFSLPLPKDPMSNGVEPYAVTKALDAILSLKGK